jgi:5-methylcytosine-specific restriction protein A
MVSHTQNAATRMGIPTRRDYPQSIPRRTPAPATGDYDRSPDRREAKAFYKSRAWRAVRAAVLLSSPLCADCQRAGKLTAAAHVHHVRDRRHAPALALDRSNLEGLCQPCHNRRRRDRNDASDR